MQEPSTINVFRNNFRNAQQSLDEFMAIPEIFEKLEYMTKMMLDTFNRGGTIFSCGNGGSHCDALHFAEEWTGRYRKERKPMGALALGEASHMSCVGNDFGFEKVFERQLQALGRPGDLLLLISSSGQSKNQWLAVEAARSKGIQTVAILGRDGGELKSMANLSIVVPAKTSDRIQEIQMKIWHSAIEAVERILFPELYLEEQPI
jgi:D-sedoheptulose 7-phosphate isomerase